MSGAFVVGTALTAMGKHEGVQPTEMAVDLIARALADARLDITEVDGLFTCPHGFLRERERFLTQRMAQRLDIAPRVIEELDAGGTTSGLLVQHAARAVANGRARCVVVYAAEVEMRPEAVVAEIARNRHLVFEANALYGAYDGAYGLLAVVPMYAMASQRYMHDHRVSPEAVACVSVVLREHAARHPLALYRKPITIDDVLASRVVAPPIHLLEACPWSNGGAAIVVACEAIARACGRPVVRVEGIGEAHDPESFFPTRVDGGRFPSIARAMHDALDDAKIALDEIDVAEVYGTFSAVELMCYEELGFFARGHAGGAVAEGRTRIDGDRPINTSGGRLSFGHPPYVTPLAECAEIVAQLRGDAGERQVRGAEVGLVHAEHGMVNGATVTILRRAG